MRIIIIADHAHINGGQAKVSIESAIGLAGRGHEVIYFAAVAPVDARLEQAGIRVVCLEQPDIISAQSQLKFAIQVIWNLEAAKRLKDLIAGFSAKDTVIHIHAWAKSLSPSIGPVIASSGLPAIYTMHEFFLACPNGGFYDYKAQEPCTRKPLSLSCISTNCDGHNYARKILRMGRQVLVDRFSGLRDIRHIISISQLQEEVMKPLLPATAQFHRVNNPISVVKPDPKPAKPSGSFLFVGRVSTEKGIAHFCEAAKLANVTPVIAGDGPLMGELKAKYPDAQMLGWKNPDEISQLVRDARALVFPSIWYEGQPLTVYEALANGTPVIVSDVCAGREAIVDGENGLWFKSANPQSLSEALLRMSNDAEAARMTKNAYEMYWNEPLTMDRHLDALMEVYEEALHCVSIL